MTIFYLRNEVSVLIVSKPGSCDCVI